MTHVILILLLILGGRKLHRSVAFVIIRALAGCGQFGLVQCLQVRIGGVLLLRQCLCLLPIALPNTLDVILRALGASLKHVLGLILLETFLISSLAVIFACLSKIILEFSLGPWLESRFGLYLQGPTFSNSEIFYMIIMMVSALLISFIPAVRAMRAALKDGLSLKL